MELKVYNAEDLNEMDVFNKDIEGKKITRHYLESPELFEYLDENEYNYYRIAFDKTLSLKNLIQNIKTYASIKYNNIKDFILAALTKNFDYEANRDFIVVDLSNKKIDHVKFHTDICEYGEQLKTAKLKTMK